MDAMTCLLTRRSVRSYQDRQVEEEKLQKVLEAGMYAPTGMNTQSPIMVVVQDKATRDQLSRMNAAVMNGKGDPFYGAPTVIIAAYDHDVSSHPTPDHGPETCDFGDIDTTIALTNMENAAASLGLGSCWVGAFDPRAVRERFDVPESYRLVELFMIGHPKAAPGPRHTERRALDEIVCREAF